MGLTSFGGAFVPMRIVVGHLPDRMGSSPRASVSIDVETIGRYLSWTAPGPALGFSGAFLAEHRCSLIFPAMGVEVVRRVPPHLRGHRGRQLPGLPGPRLWPHRARMAGLLAKRFGFTPVVAIARQDRQQAA